MSGPAAESVSLILLVLTLLAAVVRPFGWTEAVTAVPAAALLVLLGVVPVDAAVATLRHIAPTVAFLAAILLLGHLCADAGVFHYLGSTAGRITRGSPRRLLILVVGVAAGVTVTLTLDATVVLLTPVVLVTAGQL